MLTKKKDAKLYAASQTLWIYDICWELGWGGDTNEFLEAFDLFHVLVRLELFVMFLKNLIYSLDNGVHNQPPSHPVWKMSKL